MTDRAAPAPTADRRVAIIGLGYVGLPLAISFVEAGLEVEGIDAHRPRVEELSAGRSPIDDITNDRLAPPLSHLVGLLLLSLLAWPAWDERFTPLGLAIAANGVLLLVGAWESLAIRRLAGTESILDEDLDGT